MVAIAANCENSSGGGKLLVNEIVSVTRLLLVTEMHKADEVSEARLVVEIDDELDEVSEVDYDELMSDDEMDEDCEVHQADER